MGLIPRGSATKIRKNLIVPYWFNSPQLCCGNKKKKIFRFDSSRLCREKISIEFAENSTFAVAIAQNEKIVGTIGLHRLDSSNKSIQIGYWLDKQAQGKGLATRCCRILINHAFDELKLNRIQINCNVENVKSRVIPEKLGFRLEGIHRQVEWLNEEFRDWAIYAMLKEDWDKIK